MREEAAEQKSITDHEHATQMEWFSIACDYKAEAAALQKRLEKAVELPCKVGDTVFVISGTEIKDWQVEKIILNENGYMICCGHAGTDDYNFFLVQSMVYGGLRID